MPLTARKPSQELVDIVGALGGRWSGYVAMCRCPAHDDRDPSLSIRQGDKGPLVTCFAGCSREDVLRELRGVRLTRHYRPPPPFTPRGQPNVERLWDRAIDVRGTLAEQYLMSRKLTPPPADIRFLARCPFLPRPRTIFQPAMLVAVRDQRRLVAIQRIFLDPRTATYVRKVMLGTPLSGAWRGRGRGATLAIAEGFETADAFTRLSDIPCWASLGARRLDQLSLPSDITTLVIAEDNDLEGHRAGDKAQDRYSRPGLTIRRMPPRADAKDWAEVLERR